MPCFYNALGTREREFIERVFAEAEPIKDDFPTPCPLNRYFSDISAIFPKFNPEYGLDFRNEN